MEGNYPVLCLYGEYEGIHVKLGEVSFSDPEEGSEDATMHFNYDITEGLLDKNQVEAFELYVGDIIVEIIQDRLEKGDLIYTGGTDEVDNEVNPEE